MPLCHIYIAGIKLAAHTTFHTYQTYTYTLRRLESALLQYYMTHRDTHWISRTNYGRHSGLSNIHIFCAPCWRKHCVNLSPFTPCYCSSTTATVHALQRDSGILLHQACQRGTRQSLGDRSTAHYYIRQGRRGTCLVQYSTVQCSAMLYNLFSFSHRSSAGRRHRPLFSGCARAGWET